MSCALASPRNTEVSFYLVKNKISDDDIRKNNLSGAVLDKSPVFTTKDIIEYSQSENTIKLTKEAYKNFLALRDYDCFAICVDNKPVYLGKVEHPSYWSSLGFNGLTASEVRMNNEIHLLYWALTPDGGLKIEKEVIDDPRHNKLILDSLRKSNKLVE